MNLPKRVTLELTNRCNRKCAGCPRLKMEYPIGDMSISLLTKITSQLPNNVCIVPFYRGEPLLHPAFPEAIHLLERFDTVQLATNGDYLTESNRKAILRACTFVSLSLHRFLMPQQTRWTSFLYDCLGADIETQVSILDSLMDELKRCKFITEWKKHANRVRIYETHSKTGFGSMHGRQSHSACHKPFEEMVVYWDGKVGLCNHDWNNLFAMGDLNDESIAEVWNGLSYDYVRKLHSINARQEIPTCKDCSFESNKIYGELIKNGGQIIHNPEGH